jgi:hypothetical protein
MDTWDKKRVGRSGLRMSFCLLGDLDSLQSKHESRLPGFCAYPIPSELVPLVN